MRALWIWTGTLGFVCGLMADEPEWHRMTFAPSTWHLERSGIEIKENELLLRAETDQDGFAMLKRMPFRRRTAVEADLQMTRRPNSRNWSLAGVTLFQDMSNYWMLSLVEGPDGKRSVDFIEKHNGVWQAQSQSPTALKREGTLSFAWEPDEPYRLRLETDDIRICATIFSAKSGAVLGSASYLFENRPAVRGGWSGLIVRDSECRVSGFRVRRMMPQQEGSLSSGRVALLDDDLPGHDRAANALLAEALAGAGFDVERMGCDRMLSPGVLSGDNFALAIIPRCDSVPASMHEIAVNAMREGVGVIFLGGPFLDRALCKVNGRWLDHSGQQALLQETKNTRLAFEIGPDLKTGEWRRACQDKRKPGELHVVQEGPDGESCLRYDSHELAGWDIWHSPETKGLFGEGDGLFCFKTKGDANTTQLAVEISERDGSRWIATADLTDQWRRVVIRVPEFHYWHDSSTGDKRGGPGDRLNPDNAIHVGFGLSRSHTPEVNGGKHTVWLAEIGTAPDPLADVAVAPVQSDQAIECITPRYKVYRIDGPAQIRDTTATGNTTPFLPDANGLVCAIPRTLGEGFNRDNPWRFIPCAQVASAGAGQQVCEWLLTYNRFPLAGRSVAGFGYRDPATWSSPAVLPRITSMAGRMCKGLILEEAGSEQFVYRPGEQVKLGAKVHAFDSSVTSASVEIDLLCGDETVLSRKLDLKLNEGTGRLSFDWQPPRESASYIACAMLKKDEAILDMIQHEFAVLDPAPAKKEEFITVAGGDFLLEGKKWYPVGVNFWPLYVSGMDARDYTAGWLKNSYYSPTLVECDLQQMASMGINLVSIQTPPVEHYRNLLDFLRRCKKHGIHANLYLGQASPVAFKEREVKQYLETAGLPGNSTVFAYDTIWEPGNHLFKDDEARSKWDTQWREWINEQYGSPENAEASWECKARRDKKGAVISPPDKWFREDGVWRRQMAAYRRFMDNATSRLWGAANRRLRALDPNHLVSFRQGNTLPYDFALSGPVKHIDFICPEGYAVPNSDQGEAAIGFITRYCAFTTAGKPIVWSEFGMSVWDAGSMTWSDKAVTIQGEYSERFYRTALEAGAHGTIPWWWPGGYRVNERSDFGIIEPDRTERPAAGLIRQYGPLFSKPRKNPQPDEWLDYDRDAHAGGYCRTAFHEGADAYKTCRQEGRLLGIKTKGTGTTSIDVPLVAVGNVPCNGTNPPKYLDAEFNWFQVLDQEGNWRDVKDDGEVNCVSGAPLKIRVSLGNLQQATWIPPHEAGNSAGGVALVVRSDGGIVARLPLKQRVAYLQDADFGECFLLQNINKSTRLSARLEALGRTPFGESRTFSLKVK